MKLDQIFIIKLDEHGGPKTTEPASPELIAEIFAGMYSDEQAQFFNHLAEVASKWGKGGEGNLYMQLQYVTDEDGLTLAGRRAMQGIGEYSHWGLFDNLQP